MRRMLVGAVAAAAAVVGCGGGGGGDSFLSAYCDKFVECSSAPASKQECVQVFGDAGIENLVSDDAAGASCLRSETCDSAEEVCFGGVTTACATGTQIEQCTTAGCASVECSDFCALLGFEGAVGTCEDDPEEGGICDCSEP